MQLQLELFTSILFNLLLQKKNLVSMQLICSSVGFEVKTMVQTETKLSKTVMYHKLFFSTEYQRSELESDFGVKHFDGTGVLTAVTSL